MYHAPRILIKHREINIISFVFKKYKYILYMNYWDDGVLYTFTDMLFSSLRILFPSNWKRVYMKNWN